MEITLHHNVNFEKASKELQVRNWDAFPKLGMSEIKYFDLLTPQVVTQILLSLCLKCLIEMFNLVRKRCVLWLKTSLSYRERERGPVAVKSLWCSDFDVRLSGLSYGTVGQHSLTGLVPPFLLLPLKLIQSASQSSLSKRSPTWLSDTRVSHLYWGINL